MAKARIWGYPNEGEMAKGNVAIMCPGCKCHHIIATVVPQTNGAKWDFNGNMEKPTFRPSLLVKTGSYACPGFKDPEGIPPVICHSFITDGKIQFCGDSTHELKNQTVDLPEVDL